MTLDTPAILSELRELKERLDLHALEMTNLRAFLDTQFKRIAEMQAELDVLPAARKRRTALRAPLQARLRSHNGNGHNHP